MKIVLQNDLERAMFIVLGLVSGLLGLGAIGSSGDRPPTLGLVAGTFLIAAAIITTWCGLRVGTIVSESGLTLRALRTRSVPWSEIEEIWIDRDGSLMNWSIVRLRTRQGRVRTLPGAAAGSAERRAELEAVVEDLNRLRTRRFA